VLNSAGSFVLLFEGGVDWVVGGIGMGASTAQEQYVCVKSGEAYCTLSIQKGLGLKTAFADGGMCGRSLSQLPYFRPSPAERRE
jgi:hypothetical protein